MNVIHSMTRTILLGVNGDAKDCKIDSKKGQYVSVSTIGMDGPDPLDTSNPTGPHSSLFYFFL